MKTQIILIALGLSSGEVYELPTDEWACDQLASKIIYNGRPLNGMDCGYYTAEAPRTQIFLTQEQIENLKTKPFYLDEYYGGSVYVQSGDVASMVREKVGH